MKRYNPRQRRRNLQKIGVDKGLFVLALLFTTVGVVAVSDVSAPQALSVFSDPFYFAKQQFLWAVIGIGAMIVVSKIRYTFWKKVALPIFVLSLVLMVAVLLPGVGNRVLGARRWISLGSFSFQPSELIKLSLALMFAKMAEDERPFYQYVVVMGVVGVLIMLQPDLGTAIVVTAIGFSQLFVSGASVVYLALLSGGGVLLGSLAVFTSEYRRARLSSFLEASHDPLGASYHIRQVLIALGSGGVFGVGLGQSRQKHLFLPETATDSVFAVLAEEIGFFGGTVLIVALFILVFRSIRIASQSPDTFSRVLAGGIAVWIGGQIFLNIASMVSLVPLTGIPLPFFSYGGSSLLAILISIGVLLSISRESYEAKKRD